MFPQDPCIIYIEKECKVQVSVHRLQACHSYFTVLGGWKGISWNCLQKLPQGQRRAKAEVE